MTIEEFLINSQKKLKSVNIATARLDSLILLETVLKKDRAWLLANQDYVLRQANYRKLNKLLDLRLTYMPIAYITKSIEFYGHTFFVNNKVLVPRPESEDMIELLIEALGPNSNFGYEEPAIKLIDIGTGSGVLGITAKLLYPKLVVDLVDIDKNALKIAKFNVDKFTLDINISQGDLLADKPKGYDIVFANLPYVPDKYQINEDAKYEPKHAIFAGKIGTELYRSLFMQLQNKANKPLYILIESFPWQHKEITAFALVSGYKHYKTQGYVVAYKLDG